MTVSGTTSFNLDLTEIVEESFERCGKELKSGYDLRTARRSLNILFADWANRGVNLWTVQYATLTLTAGTATYSLPTDCVDLLEHVIRTGTGTNQADLTITRISVSTYATIPNKNATGRPIQVYIDRAQSTPSITVWPVPDSSTSYTFAYWYLRRINDAGTGANTMDIPFRFIPPMVAGLAFQLSMKLPGAETRTAALKADYMEAWQNAADEDRDKAAVRFVPRMGFIR